METAGKNPTLIDDPRIKRVLKRYLKNEEFSDATLELTGIGLQELQSLCRCSAEHFNAPIELDGYGLVNFTNRLSMSFDASAYDYFIHSYVRREFCSSDRIPPKDLSVPCEDGPPANIPLEKGLRWVSARPKDGEEHYLGIVTEE